MEAKVKVKVMSFLKIVIFHNPFCHILETLKGEISKNGGGCNNALKRQFQKQYEFSQKCYFFKIFSVTYWKQNGGVCHDAQKINGAPKFSTGNVVLGLQ